MTGAAARPYHRRWLDRYYLCEPIASGGMATVHAALAMGSAGFHRLVAIKLMHHHLCEQDGFLTMFEDEARISAHLHHPFLAPVLDHGVHEGEAFLVMDYLDGVTLHTLFRRLRQSPLFPALERWRWALRLVADACEGLHAAHEARGEDGMGLGIVHRDVTPSNLFLCRDGTVRVLDFGVVKSLGRQQLTETGAFKGKLAYMAPEYLKTGKLDRRADIFALGLVLQELLSLRRAYGTSEESLLLQRVIQGEILPLRGQLKEMPVELERVVHKAIARDPEGRYPTARSFGLAIEKVISTLGDPFSIGQSAESFAIFFPGEDSRVEALLRVLPEARSSRSNSSGVVRVTPSPTSQPAPLLWEPVAAPLEQASTTGTLRSGERPAPSRLRRSWILPVLFLGGGVGGGALVALHNPSLPAASVPSTPVSLEFSPIPRGEAVPFRTVEAEVVVSSHPLVSSKPGPSAPPAPGPVRSPSPQGANSVKPTAEQEASVRVTVSTPGGTARVYWRGTLQGSTPSTLWMPPGRYTLELEPPGAPRRPVNVAVSPGEPVYVSVPIERLLPVNAPDE